MQVKMSFVEKKKLEKMCNTIVRGRILSLNVGKNICMGVIHINEGYCMYRYAREAYEKKNT